MFWLRLHQCRIMAGYSASRTAKRQGQALATLQARYLAELNGAAKIHLVPVAR